MLLNLPTELVVQILLYLDTDLASCRLTCKYLASVVRDSVVLQYHMALIGARATDNPCSELPLSKKLEQLKNGERAWAVLKPTSTTTITVKHNTSGIYDLTGGVYLLGNQSRRDLHYVRLPSHPGEDPEWSTIHVGRTIIDMGLCVYEHDLIAVVTTTPKPGTPASYDIELVLFEFSTCKPHPLAQKHVIHVMNTPWEKPAIGIEIVGDNLVLVLYHYRHNAKPEDRVFIFEWKTAVVKTSFAVPTETYTGLIFLDEHTILLPNTNANALDIYRIPEKPTLHLTPVLSLLLPRLADNRTVGGISCRAEPNPIGASSYIHKKKQAKERSASLGDEPQEEDMFPKRGYLADAETAICIFALRVQGVELGQFLFGHTFTFVVLRNSLLDALAAFESGQAAGRAPRPSHPSSESSDPAVALAPTIGWAEWGPGITRWFNSDSIPTRWITTTAGQRCVLIAESAPETGFPYVVLNFNPESVRKMKAWLKASREREKARELRSREETRERALEEAREWAESTMAAQAEDGHMDADGDFQVSRYEIPGAVEYEDGDGSPMVYHTGLAIVDEDDLPPSSHAGPSISWQSVDLGGDMLHSTSTAAASSSAAEGDIDEAVQEHVHFDAPNGHAHEDTDSFDLDAEASAMEFDVDVDTSDENASMHHMDFLDSASDAGGASSVANGHIGAERSVNNPLDEPDVHAARRVWCVTTAEIVEPADTFAEHVEGRLPYVACASAQTYAYHGVLLDEERVIGIRTDFLDRIRQIEVHHFG